MNIFLAGYFFAILVFVLIFLAILYHLWFFHLNRKTAILMSAFFVAGSLILLIINFDIASQIPWSDFYFLF